LAVIQMSEATNLPSPPPHHDTQKKGGDKIPAPPQTNRRKKLYFTTSVRKFGCVVDCPFNVAVSEIVYVPGGVACPVGLFGKLPHEPAPNATKANTAKLIPTRRERPETNAIPPISSEPNSIPIPPPNPKPPGKDPVCVTVVPWQYVCSCTACSAPPGHVTVFGIKFTLISGEFAVAVNVTVPVCPGAQVMINPK
jgi:hypothetical protein